ncbi:FACT complex subunit SPT16 N-terminal lobe domain-containing protein [Chytriomyces cf. hyalinus JEL632]|nr:FACT complex subunit SPT16 N-terminal lobe domain-containing protein [Chytriomyces cf. hyalinus JEL632]
MAVELSAKQFHSRARTLLNTWKTDSDNSFAGADCVVVAYGLADENEAGYQKTSAVQLWLLGYEFTDTILVFLKDRIAVLTSQKKANMLQALEQATGIDQKIPLMLFRRGKDDAANKVLFEDVAKLVKEAGGKVGVIAKDKQKGKFIDEWKAVLAAQSVEEVDVASGIASSMAVKDSEDLKNLQMAGNLTSAVIKNFFVKEFLAIVDTGKKVTHEALSMQTEDVLLNEKKRLKMRFPKEAELDLAEWCYTPIIQSGGKYDLKPSAQSDTTSLHDGTILCSLGVRYKNYCSNLSRTFFINPEKGKEKNYIFLCELQTHILSLLKDGAVCRDIYGQAVKFIESKRPELLPNFVKTAGFAIGIEFKDSTFALSPKSSKVLLDGMTVNLSVGFHNIDNSDSQSKDPRNKTYSLLLADTIRITKDAPVFLTEFDRDFKDISWEMNEDEDEIVAETKSAPKLPTAVLKSKLRNEDEEMTNEQRRALHQKELADQRQADGLQRFAEGGGAKSLEKAQFRKFECYRKETLLPRSVDQLRIMVDKRSEAIILPIYGMAVPFHISTLKTIVKNDEGSTTYLRFNFATPGQSMGKKEASTTPFEDINSTFVKAMTFKSSDMARFAEIFREVNELKKDVSKREADRKEKAGLVEQDKLIESRGQAGGRRMILRDVFARPALEGKRISGDLEVHTNGLRYQTHMRDQKIDVLFSNIKHLVFQPCEGELIVLIHIHLKNEIMIGRKKTKDVQFYREVTDANFDETGNRKRRQNYGDEDEFAAEQAERQRRAQLDKEFKQFAEKIADASQNQVEVDAPFRDLGFQGVPFRQPVLMVPTTDCLVHLVEPPFFVVTISEIELVHLERVRFGLKSFDMVVVFKDFSRPVQHINTIHTDQLENLKEWLDSVDVPFTEGPTNLSWPQIMKTVNESPFDFFNEGGWSFLKTDADDDDDEEDEESAYEDSDAESADESESDSEEYNSDDDASGSGYSDDDSEEEEGEDWDELERKAAKSDKRKDERDDISPVQKKGKRRDYDSDEERPKKKKFSGGR